ncbi:MAG TPA: hypothetical protein VN524_07665 [Hyphomicrobiaceae bacterium]|jgi:hypothetical protein|nr:hypothetical protein [Hyphomicrobiaceae bacterium]
MAFATSIGGWQRPALAVGGLGLVSGLLSATVGFDLELAWLKPVGTVFFLDAGPVPIGFFYGVAIAIGLWLVTGNAWALPVLPVVVMYAWSAAIQVGVRLQRNIDDDPHLITASLAAGAVGAGITHAGCAIFASDLRRPARVALTCIVGAVAGLLLFMGQRKWVDDRLLFAVWQPAVAFCIGVGLGGWRSRGD